MADLPTGCPYRARPIRMIVRRSCLDSHVGDGFGFSSANIHPADQDNRHGIIDWGSVTV